LSDGERVVVRIVIVFSFILLTLPVWASVDSVRQRNRSKVAVDTSALRTVNRVLIIGNKVTRDKIILRELTLKNGDTVRVNTLARIIEKDQIKLINTRLFNTVSIRSLDYENGIIDLLIEVSERWYTFPIPILELADRNVNEWWQNYNHDFNRVNYGLRLYKYNFRGRNETLLLNTKFGFTNIIKLTYRIPYLDRQQKHGLAVQVDYDERKNIAFQTVDNILDFQSSERNFKVSRGAGITYTYRNSFYHYHGFTFDFSISKITDSLVRLNDSYFGEASLKRQQYTSVAYQYVYEHRDFVSYPLKGSYVRAGIRQYGLLPNDNLTKTEVTASYAKYADLGRKFFLSNYTGTLVSSTHGVPYANFSALGYNREFIRGYEVYLIEGPQYIYNKTSFKKRLYSNVFNLDVLRWEQFQKIPLSIYLKTYADVGYVWNYPGYTNGKRLTDKLLTGIGFGLDFVSSHDATIRLEYSFNKEGEHGFFFHLKKEF